MRVSVVIPTFNNGPVVAEAVESALGQSHAPHQIIVVDDGSTDDTAARMQPFVGRVDYIRQPNGKVAAARNTGISRATGDTIAFLDADDVWHPHKLKRQVSVLTRYPDIGLVASEVTP